MENSYGIGVSNRYELFYDDDADPLEILVSREKQENQKTKQEVNKKQKTTPVKGKETVSNKQHDKENKAQETTKNTEKIKPQSNKKLKENQSANVKSSEVPLTKEVKEGLFSETNRARSSRAAVDRDRERDRDRDREKTVKFSSETNVERNNRRNFEERPTFTSSFDEFRETPRFDNESSSTVGSSGGGGGSSGGGGGGGFPRGRGGRGGRGRGRGRGGFDMRGKREFDRQSGSDRRVESSGVKAYEKREGGGAHNWGSYKDEINEQLNTTSTSEENEWAPEKTDTAADTTTENTETPAQNGEEEGSGEKSEETTTPAEEEKKEMTLDEWRAKQSPRNKPTFKLRRAGEGEDQTRWKKMVQLKKKDEAKGGGGMTDEVEDFEEISDKPQRNKKVLDIEFRFNDVPRGRGRGRGGRRGEGRGGMRGTPRNMGMRGQPRTPRQSAPKVDDEKDFPSLG